MRGRQTDMAKVIVTFFFLNFANAPKKLIFSRTPLIGINPLNAELNPNFHLLALLGAHHILHVSRIRVNWEDEPSGYAENLDNWISL